MFIQTIHNFIKAKSPEMLRKEMRKNNLRKGTFFKYEYISFDGEYWFAWYLEEENAFDAVKPKEVIDAVKG